MAVPVVQESVTTARGALNPAEISIDVSSMTISEGDLLIAQVALQISNGTPPNTFTPPSGWTLICQDNGPASPSTYEQEAAYFYKIAGASEPSSYTFSWTTRDVTAASIVRITGHDGSSPIDVSAQSTDNSSTTQTCPSVTTTVDDCLVLRYAATAALGSENEYTGTPTGTTVYNLEEPGATVVTHALVSQSQATAGSTGTAAYTFYTARDHITTTIAIAPASGGGGGSTAQVIACII